MVEIYGECDPAFTGVRDHLIKQIRYFGGGAGACVYYEGEKVVDIWLSAFFPARTRSIQ